MTARPVICIQHCKNGLKKLKVENPPGDGIYEAPELTPLSSNKLMQELISPRCDGGWVRIAIL